MSCVKYCLFLLVSFNVIFFFFFFFSSRRRHTRCGRDWSSDVCSSDLLLKVNNGKGPKGALLDAINDTFGSFDKFKEEFSKAAATRFGSGWAWLIVTKDNKLKVTSTLN